MRSYEKIKNDYANDIDLKLIILLKTYFRNLSDLELTQICEDIVIKYNENKQLEKLKNLKKLVIFKKQQDIRLLLKKFFNWKKNVFNKNNSSSNLNCNNHNNNYNNIGDLNINNNINSQDKLGLSENKIMDGSYMDKKSFNKSMSLLN